MTTHTSAEDVGLSVAEDPTSALLAAFDPAQTDISSMEPDQAQALLIAGLTLDAKGNEMLAQQGLRSVEEQVTRLPAKAAPAQPIFLGRSKQQAPTAPQEGTAPVPRVSIPFDLNSAVQRANTPYASFDVETELEKLRSIADPTERFEYASTVQANISIRAAGILSKYQKVASEQAGLTFATQNLANNISLDQQTGFYAKYGEASKQTEAAQALLNTARVSSDAFARQLADTDPEFAKLSAVNKRLMSMETLSMNQAIRADAKLEKKEEERTFITAPMIANYKFMTGDSETDTGKLKDAVLVRYKKEPGFRKVLEASKEDLPALLTDSDPTVRQDAFKVLLGTERVLRAIPAGASDPSYMRQIKAWVDNPELLTAKQEAMTKDEKERMASIMAKTGKEKSQELANFRATMLTKNMERAAKEAFVNDLRGWKTSETADGTPLGGIIKEVSQANSFGPAKMPAVVAKYMLADIEVPVGTPGSAVSMGKNKLTHASKLKVLEAASSTALTNAGKTVLLPDSDALAVDLKAQVRIEAQKAIARVQGLFGIGSDLFGFSPIKF